MPAKDLVEVQLIAHADLQGHIADLQVAFRQQFGRLFHAHLMHILKDALARGLLEQPSGIGFIEADFFGDHRERDLLAVILTDEAPDLLGVIRRPLFSGNDQRDRRKDPIQLIAHETDALTLSYALLIDVHLRWLQLFLGIQVMGRCIDQMDEILFDIGRLDHVFSHVIQDGLQDLMQLIPVSDRLCDLRFKCMVHLAQTLKPTGILGIQQTEIIFVKLVSVIADHLPITRQKVFHALAQRRDGHGKRIVDAVDHG